MHRDCDRLEDWASSRDTLKNWTGSSRNPTKWLEGSKTLWKNLKKLGSFSLKKRRFRWDVITVFQEVKDNYREDGGNSLHKEQSDRARGNRHKLVLKFCLDATTKYLLWGQLHIGTGCPEKSWTFSCQKYLILSLTRPQITCLKQKLDQIMSRGLFQSRLS